MPDTPVNPAEQNKHLALDPKNFGGYYMPYVTGADKTPEEKALTTYFNVYKVLGQCITEDDLARLFGEQEYTSGTQAEDGHFVKYVLYKVDRKGLSSFIANYANTVVIPKIKELSGSAESKQRNARKLAALTAEKSALNSVFTTLQDAEVFIRLQSALVIMTDPVDQTLQHIWGIVSAQDARKLTANLKSIPLPLEGHPLNAASTETKDEDNEDKSGRTVDDDLHLFFSAATKNKLKLHPMQEAEGVERSTDLFMYHLSTETQPTSAEYFASCADVDGATEEFAAAANRLSKSIKNSEVFALAKMNTDGSAQWFYFGDKDSAVNHMRALAVTSNPEFRSRLDTAFGSCEAFKDHSNVDEAADFVIGYISKPEQNRFNILTAYTSDKVSSTPSITNLPEVSGIFIKNNGSTVSIAFLDATQVFQHLVNNKAHLDKHGSDLLENLVQHKMWANLIDFCSSIFGEGDILKAGNGRLIELPEDAAKRILKFHTLFNASF